jgi:nicotinamidase-related amidase
VSATVRSALDHGFRSTVVASACATRALPSPLGGAIEADKLHEASLAALADLFAAIVADGSAIT